MKESIKYTLFSLIRRFSSAQPRISAHHVASKNHHASARYFVCILFGAFSILPLCADTITFSASLMKGNTAEGREYTKLEENALIKTESIEVTADTIELAGSEYRFITAQSNVRGKSFSSGFDFSCNKLSFDRETNIIVLEGNVSLTDTANDVDAYAQIIEYDQNIDVAVMQIGVRLLNKTSVCSGALAIYRKIDKTVELSGSPNIVRGSDNFRAQEIILNLETEEITLDGKVRGSVSDDGTNGGER